MPIPAANWVAAGGLAAVATGSVQLDALARLAARLHPVIVHFPVALLIVGALVEAARAVRGKSFGPSPAGLLCWTIGSVGALAAAGSGWLNAAVEQGADGGDTMEVHRWIGVGVAAASLLVLALGLAAARRERERDETGGGVLAMYRIGAVVCAAAVGVGAHFGGMMTYGPTYLSDAVRAVIDPSTTPSGGTRPGTPAAPIPSNPAASTPTPPPADGTPGKIDFTLQVRPILAAACFECHGGGKHKAGLALDDKAGAMKGGRHGPVITAGDPDQSLLIQRVRSEDDEDRMPLHREALTDEQIRILSEWIRQGAAWPESSADTQPPAPKP